METIFIGHSEGLDRVEVNGAATTERVLQSAPVAQIAVDPGDPRRVYAATLGDGVFRSTDAGRTFERLDGLDVSLCWSVAVSASDVTAGIGAVYVGTQMSALFRSTDGGNQFEELTSLFELETTTGRGFPRAPGAHHIHEIMLDAADPDTIVYGIGIGEASHENPGGSCHLSRDCGETWERNAERLPGATRRYYGLPADRLDSREVVSFGAQHLFAENAVAPKQRGTAAGTLATGAPGIHFYVTEQGEIYRSDDDGESFGKVELSKGALPGKARSVLVLADAD